MRAPCLAFCLALAATLPDDHPAPVVLASTDGMDAEVVAAIEQAVARVREEPGSAAHHLALGVTYEANGHGRAARDCYQHAAALAPEDIDVAYRLGVMLGMTNEPMAALEVLEQVARSQAPTQHRLVARARAGGLWFELGEFDRSAEAWRGALAVEGEVAWPQSRVGLAAALVELGEAEQAVELLLEVLALHPDYGHAHSVLGSAWLELDREEAADCALLRGEGSTFEYPLGPHVEVLDAARTGLRGRFARARSALGRGQLDAAEAEARAIKDRYPDSSGVWILLGDITRLRGDELGALEFYRQGAAHHPEDLPSQVELAIRTTELARRSTDPEARRELVREAYASSTRALRLAPRNGEALVVRGRVLMHLADPAQPRAALDHLLAAEQVGAQEAGLYEDLARLSADLGSVEGLVHYAELSAQHSPWRLEAWTYLAGVYRAVGRAGDADAAEEQARRLGAR